MYQIVYSPIGGAAIIQRKEDGAFIPPDDRNADYHDFKIWNAAQVSAQLVPLSLAAQVLQVQVDPQPLPVQPAAPDSPTPAN